MPELPEVETIKNVIGPQLRGRTVVSLTLNRPEIIMHPAAEDFERILVGARFLRMGRRGKFLLFNLRGGCTLILHLRMTGCLLVTEADLPLEKHTHAVFHLDNGHELRFIDPRRFGRFWLLRKGENDIYSGIDKLGPEPFDVALTADYLKNKLGLSRRAIKGCLLDQSVVAGIGNIYSDEILFEVMLYPARPATELTDREWQDLAAAIPTLLSRNIDDNKMSAQEYLAGKGREYRNTPLLKVYGHQGLPCPRCGHLFERIVIAGRSSCYCPFCQRP